MVGLCPYQKDCQMQVGLTDTSTRLVRFFATKLEFVLKVFIVSHPLAIVSQATAFHLDSKLLHTSLGLERPIFWQQLYGK